MGGKTLIYDDPSLCSYIIFKINFVVEKDLPSIKNFKLKKMFLQVKVE